MWPEMKGANQVPVLLVSVTRAASSVSVVTFSAAIARLCASPAAMATGVLPLSVPEAVMATGAVACEVLLLPTWPLLFAPQPASVPSVHRVRLWLPPASRREMVFPESAPLVVMNTGEVALVVEELPSWP